MHFDLERLARDLVRGAFLELYLTPKPGLVDQEDCGAHGDLTLARMETSLGVVSRYLAELADSLAGGESLAEQVRLGRAAERDMHESAGANCHKGYIFLSGLFLSACAQSPGPGEGDLRLALAELAGRFFARGEAAGSNGSRVRDRFQAGGIKAEALAGLPSLFGAALPAFRAELARGGNRGSAVYAMLGRLMATVEDTTALHRCGRGGLATLRRDGVVLERLVAEREDFFDFLRERNRRYVRRNLTMGGVADLLALALAWLSHTGELAAPGRIH